MSEAYFSIEILSNYLSYQLYNKLILLIQMFKPKETYDQECLDK